MKKQINLFGKELNCYKTNLHSHTTNSDGVFSPEELCSIYENEGYDVLAITDHYKTNQVSKIETEEMLLISGMEYHPGGPRNITLHLLALNIPEDFQHPSKLPFQESIEAVRKAGGECILAHPYWSGLNTADIMEVKDIIGVEIYNATCRRIGKSDSTQTWDNILDLGDFLPATAADDTHRAQDLFHGWTMVCAKEKTPEAIMEAIKTRSIYASQGPEFTHLSYQDGTFSLECTPCTEVVITGNLHFGRCGAMPGLGADSVEAAKNPEIKEITSFSADIPTDAGLTYVRCQITDKNGKRAWSPPVEV
jgi:hypothetical protein